MKNDVYEITGKGTIVAIDLTPSQVTELAKPFAIMLDSITKFYETPEVKKGFEEWHIKKFGCKPKEGSA